MSDRHIVVQWEPRPETASAIARQLSAVMDWLRTVDGLGGEWAYAAPASTTLTPVDGAAALERAVEVGARPFPTAREPEPPVGLFKQDFYLGRLRSWRAHLQIVAGARAPVAGLHLVNRVALAVRPPLAPQSCRQVLVGLVGVLRPVSGFVGDAALVERALSPGLPCVGELTFLSAWFGGPPPLPEGVLVSPIKSFGTLLQTSALPAFEAALRQSGWLRPFVSNP